MDNLQEFLFDSNVKNDQIDIYGDLDIHVNKLESDPDIPNELQVEISGHNIDNSVANAIRQTIMKSIPIYGFHRSNVHIETDKSMNIYNSDMIYNQIETLPIFDIPNTFDLENPELYLPTDVFKSLFSSYIRVGAVSTTVSDRVIRLDNKDDAEVALSNATKHLSKIELSINVKNLTDTYKFVSTHDAVIRIDGKVSDAYAKREPISILVLKPGEDIFLRAEANLSIALIYASYEATTNVVSKELSSSKYVIIYETLEQLDKHVIFTKACVIMERKLRYLREYLTDKFNSKDINLPDKNELIEVRLVGEGYAVGYLLATALQKCTLIEKAGYKESHPFNQEIIICYKLMPEVTKNPIKILTDVISYCMNVFNRIIEIGFKKKNKSTDDDKSNKNAKEAGTKKSKAKKKSKE